MTKAEVDALKTWTAEELKAEMERLDEEIFMVNMIDHWSLNDNNKYHALTSRQYFIREELRSR